MDEFRSRITLSNGRDQAWVVYVEPWGEDYTLLPDESLEIVADGGNALPRFQVVENENSTQVYCEATADFAVFWEGRPVECGHNRNVQPEGKRPPQAEAAPDV